MPFNMSTSISTLVFGGFLLLDEDPEVDDASSEATGRKTSKGLFGGDRDSMLVVSNSASLFRLPLVARDKELKSDGVEANVQPEPIASLLASLACEAFHLVEFFFLVIAAVNMILVRLLLRY